MLTLEHSGEWVSFFKIPYDEYPMITEEEVAWFLKYFAGVPDTQLGFDFDA